MPRKPIGLHKALVSQGNVLVAAKNSHYTSASPVFPHAIILVRRVSDDYMRVIVAYICVSVLYMHVTVPYVRVSNDYMYVKNVYTYVSVTYVCVIPTCITK
jgi:hypothetical protein